MSSLSQKDIAAYAGRLLAETNKNIFGLNDEIRLILAAFFCGRHVLLEGNPGLGKTTLVKTLSSVLNLPYRRIQFTPDLMPSDITGTEIPIRVGGSGNGAAELDHAPTGWRFQPGPVFANLLLADEINRATPKTQSAMLEAMEEQQVTVLNKTHYLPNDQPKKDENAPFMVLATQNPIDHEGVYNLPEAQADRFMFKLIIQMPDYNNLLKIMQDGADPQEARPELPAGAPLIGEQKEANQHSLYQFKQIKREIRQVPNADLLSKHITNLVMATNDSSQLYKPVSRKDHQQRLQGLVKLLQFGLGPRAAINLLLGAKAMKLLFPEGQGDDEQSAPRTSEPGVNQLAQVLIPVLRHRLHWSYDWEEDPSFRNLPHSEARIRAYVYQLAYLTAPDDDLYRRRLKQELAKLEPSIANLP